MDANTISTLISNVGYPIVVGFVMMYYIKYQADQHAKEMDKMNVAIDNNTKALIQLTDKIEGVEHHE